jgi:DNA-binding NtrC family response regulator
VPPLRERKADIPALAQHFVAHFAEQHERPAPEISRRLMAMLMQSDWPGNVRELRNYIERVMAMTPGRVLQPIPLPPDLQGRSPRARMARGQRLPEAVADLERRLVDETLERCGGNQSRAARELGITEQSLRYRLRKYAIAGVRHSRRPRKKRR